MRHEWVDLPLVPGLSYCSLTSTLCVPITEIRARHSEQCGNMKGWEVMIWAIRAYIKAYPDAQARYFMLVR